MAFKQFTLNEHTTVTIYKRRGSRVLRLSIAPGGKIRVTIPTWAPYRSGLEFARSREAWIASQQQQKTVLLSGQAIGKAHHLQFVADAAVARPTSRVQANAITIRHPVYLLSTDPNIQQLAATASIRALRAQAEQLLPDRLRSLALRHDFNYSGVAIKQLKSRWGSCDQNQHIVLNLFLMQLPWECIDYVILHELVHTEVLHHGPAFWAKMQQVLPDVKRLRKQMRQYQPTLHS